MEKLQWCGSRRRIKVCKCLLISTEYTNVTDGQTDGRTDGYRATAQVALIHSIARQNGPNQRHLAKNGKELVAPSIDSRRSVVLVACVCNFITMSVSNITGNTCMKLYETLRIHGQRRRNYAIKFARLQRPAMGTWCEFYCAWYYLHFSG